MSLLEALVSCSERRFKCLLRQLLKIEKNGESPDAFFVAAISPFPPKIFISAVFYLLLSLRLPIDDQNKIYIWKQFTIIWLLCVSDWMSKCWQGRAWVLRCLTLPSTYSSVQPGSRPTNATCCSLSSLNPPLPVVLFFLDCYNKTKKY